MTQPDHRRLSVISARSPRHGAVLGVLLALVATGCARSTTARCASVPLEDTGPCDAFFTGYWFDGEACVEASASGCAAPEGLHPSEAACRAAHAECLPGPTGCAEVTLEAIGGCEPAYLGFRWDGTDCVQAVGTGCEWPRGLYASREACLVDYRACPGVALCEVPPEPAPEACDAIFDGWRFTGVGCEPVEFSGCDLPASYFHTEAECREAYGHCWDDDGPAASDGCVIGGCSAQLCADEPLASDCAWLPEFACYRAPDARCERQPSGACGWTPTPALEACLAAADDE